MEIEELKKENKRILEENKEIKEKNKQIEKKLEEIEKKNNNNHINKVLKKNNFHWINKEVNIVDNSKFYPGFPPDIMLGKYNQDSYSLTDGNRNHFVEFEFITIYYLKSIRIKVTTDECCLKTFKV